MADPRKDAHQSDAARHRLSVELDRQEMMRRASTRFGMDLGDDQFIARLRAEGRRGRTRYLGST